MLIRSSLAALILLVSPVCKSFAEEARVLKAFLSMEMPASGYAEDKKTYVGFEVDMVRALLVGAPFKAQVEFSDAPNWKRALELIRLGEADFLPLVSFREERLSFMDYIGVFNTEVAYLVTREDQDVPALDDLDDLALGKGFIAIDEAISWNPEFDKRLAEDADYRSNFVIRSASEYNRVLDIDRLDTDETYRATMRSQYDKVYEDGNTAVGSTAQRISYGRLGGTIVIQRQAIISINENADRIAKGGAGSLLKATRIDAFGTPVTFLASSLHTPVEIREHMKRRYGELRESGEFDEIWSKWYGAISPPSYIMVP